MSTNKNIAVIGANGFVGTEICSLLNESPNHTLSKVVRGDNAEEKIKNSSAVIYCANSSGRYFANNNPQEDYKDTVEKLAAIYSLLGDKKMILVSTISARVQLHTPYGRNRRTCELLMNEKKDLVIRLGPMYAHNNLKGALFDIILNKKVYVNESTEYSYTNVRYNARKILESMGQTGLVEIGANNAIQLGYLRKVLDSSSRFEGEDDTQIIKSNAPDSPDAYDVIDFARNVKCHGLWEK